jgi:hypothetical protein
MQRFNIDALSAEGNECMASPDDHVLQFKETSDHVFHLIFSQKEKVNDRLLIATNSITKVSIGAHNGFCPEDIDQKQCALIQQGSKASDVMMIFQTSFDCNLFVKSVRAIMDKSMFDEAVSLWPAQSRVLIDQCIAQKSESFGWGDRELVLVPSKLLIYSADKSSVADTAPSSRFPRNVQMFYCKIDFSFMHFADHPFERRPNQHERQRNSNHHFNWHTQDVFNDIEVCERASSLGTCFVLARPSLTIHFFLPRVGVQKREWHLPWEQNLKDVLLFSVL